MKSIQRWWLASVLAIIATICSVVSLFALLVLGATRWTASLNILALVLIVLAVKTRRSISDGGQ